MPSEDETSGFPEKHRPSCCHWMSSACNTSYSTDTRSASFVLIHSSDKTSHSLSTSMKSRTRLRLICESPNV